MHSLAVITSLATYVARLFVCLKTVLGHQASSTSRARALSLLGASNTNQSSVDSTSRARALNQLWTGLRLFASTLGHQASSTSRARALSLLGALIVTLVSLTSLLAPMDTQAATVNQLNFQGRLLSNGGTLIPDGDYNVEFKLYDQLTSVGSSQGVCTGDVGCLWVETRSSVSVTNGYLNVYLGDQTALPAIDWAQELFLGMNVGGIGAAVWDGEMSPRFKLTAVPFAFASANVASSNVDAVNSDDVSVTTGDTTTSGNSGDINIDNGLGFASNGGITLGATNASSVLISRSGIDTNIQGTLTLTQLATFNGNLRISDGSSNFATIDVDALAGNYTVSIPTITANDEFCLVNLSNCSTSGSGGIFTNAAGFSYVTDTAEDVVIGGTTTGTADIWLQADGAAVFNLQGADVDFNIQASGVANALFVQGSDGFVGIGNSAPSVALEVTGAGIFTGDLTVQGNTTLGNAAGDTLTILSGNGTIDFSDSYFDNCSALETVSGILTCGVDGGGVGSGVDTLAVIGSAPNANGASITGTTLTLQPASASFGGIMTTTTQSFAGDKTFNDNLTVSGNTTLGNAASDSLTILATSGATGGIVDFSDASFDTCTALETVAGVLTCGTDGGSGVDTLAVIGSAPNANGASITGTTLTLQPASASFGGIMTTTTQSFAGDKTFSNDLTVSGNTTLSGGLTVTGATNINTTGTAATSIGNATGLLALTGSAGNIFIFNGVTIDDTELNRLDGKDAALVDVNDAVTTAITGTGELATGSIASGFGTIETTNTVTGTTLNGTTGINTGAGAGTQRIDDSGNLVNIGTITSGLINGQTINATANLTGTLTVQGASTTFGVASTTTGTAIFRNAAGAGGITIAPADPGASNFTLTLPAQTGTICSTGSVCSGYQAAGNFVNFTPSAQQVDASSFPSLWINDTGGGNLIHLRQGGTDRFIVTNAGNLAVGGVGTSTLAGDLDVAGTLFAGTGDAFQVSTAGGVTAVGVNAGAGLLQGSLGATISGGAISLNDSSNFVTNINTGTSTGAVNIGNAAAGAVTLQSVIGINLNAAAVNTNQTTIALFNTTATTVNSFGAATTISLGASTGTTTVNNSLTVNGGLTVGVAGVTAETLRLDTYDAAVNGAVSGSNGYMYYDTDLNKFRCYENGAWVDCIASGTGGPATRRVTLNPEFEGGLLYADGTNNSGVMMSSYDATNRHNYYEWSTSQGTPQDYDIVIKHQLPSDWNATTEFNASTVMARTWVSNTTNAAITMTIIDEGGTTCLSAVTIEPGSNSTWTQTTLDSATINSACALTANENITIIIKVTSVSPNTDLVRVSDIQYEYDL
jgi:hypothetical protein